MRASEVLENCLGDALQSIHAAMAHWLVRTERAVIIADWSDLRAGRRWYLLRAAITVGGRASAVLDMVFGPGERASTRAEKAFVQRLAVVLAPNVKPIVVSDAGFREPWILLASPGLQLSADAIVAIYARRMQIELSFRDLKSHRYGQGFEDSLTRKAERIEVLLLLSTLAAFATWLAGLACQDRGMQAWLAPSGGRQRRRYSTMRLGREALARRWLPWPTGQLLESLQGSCQRALDPLAALT